MSVYRAIDVWERKDGHTVVRYRCIEALDNGKYSVQSADFYHAGKKSRELDDQFIELLMEQDPLNAQVNTIPPKPQLLLTSGILVRLEGNCRPR